MEISVMRCALVKEGRIDVAASTADQPSEIAEIVRKFLGQTDREHFLVVLLNARNAILGINLVSMGTLTASLVHPREVFKPAIIASAAAVVVAHNHPSGEAVPSSEDKEATRRLVKAGKILGIPLLDHVIVTDTAHFSFQSAGML